MSQTVTIRLSDELAEWLEESAARSGVSQAEVIRDQLEKARAGAAQKPFMRLAGSLDGEPDLSQRKGFTRPSQG
ncbi:ribbon-helix-helix domain-containing protein [Luteolibacter flavescens]|uniref:Ribbon-helix-helix domain-containing protein n=1 Tax=Luteolibacter flavescens TaxID=1859460 RepID=A0ABT3FRP4_9BACT|nr:CopG family transcriptional regulator [Luteolibacter flavescens]MCW1886217.1 ribbon-helix-helix domain-containing protein [Luteolibacter flavescens]